MKRHQFFAMLVAIIGTTACGNNSAIADNNYLTTQPYLPVTLTVQGDNEGSLPEFSLSDNPLRYRAYIQATPNERYRLRVTNNSDQRVGLVIAVDGRNIISGKKSYLGKNERMYILNPHDSADYEGWRTSNNQTNRFYFTNASDSYAAAWGDTSAMGVIAMAVYAERRPPEIYGNSKTRMPSAAAAEAAPSADAAAGTGFGETTYSPVVSVAFEPNAEPMEKIVLKYEWRETLCRKNILPDCRRNDDNRPDNRLWQNDNSDFAPPPPNR